MRNTAKNTSKQLSEGEKQFQVIFEQAAVGVGLVNSLNGKFLRINRKFCDIVGYSEEEMLDMDFQSITYPEDLHNSLDQIEHLNSGKIRVISTEKRYVHKNGNIVWVNATVSPVWNFSELPGYNITIIQDITERKRVEEELKEAINKARTEKNKSEAIIAALGDGIIIQDKDYNILYQNHIQTELHGEHKGELCYRVFGGRDTVCEDCPVERTFRDGNIHKSERTVEINGKNAHFELTSSPLRDPEGNIIAGVKIIRDITRNKQAEEERAQLIKREHKALAEAEAARKLERMKSLFIASTSHELRTPLNSIIGFTGILIQGWSGELNQEQKEQLEIVNSSARHLLALITDVIDVSKIEAGKICLEVSEFDLSQVVDEAILTLSANRKEKGLEVIADVEDIRMRTDRTRLLQCIINLLSNAVKFTEKGSVKITARIIQNKVDISVTDTGIGIKNEDIPKLFAPFVRLDSPLTVKTEGTGLGLYLTKKLTRDILEGDVELKSEYGSGSVFTLHIPVDLSGKI